MSRVSVDLAELALQEFYGPAVARVGHVLMYHGRLTLRQIAQHAHLGRRTVGQCLVAMMCHGHVRYSSQWDSSLGHETSYYECDPDSLYDMLRLGRAVAVVQTEISAEAAAIVKFVGTHGRVRAGDVLACFASREGEESLAGLRFRAALFQLLERSLLTGVQARDVKVRADLLAELQVKAANSLKEERRMTEVARRRHVETTVAQAQVQWALETPLSTGLLTSVKGEEGDDDDEDRILADSGSVLPDIAVPRKRRRIVDEDEGGTGDAAGEERAQLARYVEKFTVDNDALVRVNHVKFRVLFRRAELVALAEERLSPVASQVYDHLLRRLERDIPFCGFDTRLITVSTMELARLIPSNLDVSQGFAKPPADAPVDSSDDDDDDDNDEGSAVHRVKHVKRQLQALAADGMRFVTLRNDSGFGVWGVNFDELTRAMCKLEYGRVCEQKFGSSARRVLAVIRDTGMMDEKQLANVALVKQTDIRVLLTSLCTFGALDVQEVPRGNDRAPSKTFFLWYHKPQRTYATLCEMIKTSMLHCWQRIIQGKQTNESVILHVQQATRERLVKSSADSAATPTTDGDGSTSSAAITLQSWETAAYNEYQAVEMRLWTQIQRMDSMLQLFQS